MELAASIVQVVMAFPAWRPHFSFLADAAANELMALRWLHFIFGIIWIGLLYFFNLVLTPSMKALEPGVRVKVYPVLMSRAMGWFRWSALVTVMALNGGEHVSNQHLAISVGGRLGFVMLLNTWVVVWRVQKRLIAWTRAAA